MINRHRQLATQVEQAVLTRCQHLDHFVQAWACACFCRQSGQQHADLTVECVDLANCLDPWVILGHTAAVAQTGFTFVAGAGVNLRQAKAHGYLDS
ncbi:hypothetical protein D3C81_1889110 [compost metagenome]